MVDIAALLLRVFMGVVMIPHGAHKLQELEATNKKWREKYGLPTGSVLLSSVLEVVCGAAMILGIYTSIAAFILAIVMVVGTYVSIWKDHEPYLSLHRGKGWDFNLFLVGTLVAQIFLGDGVISLLHLFT